ncbi:MAG TPA: YebC/PmpR family DNA-binding transcriptional regulator [Acidimicrobiia bacterium]|nr:YebC/PmpR family DNA-binding transcriptional regulator [Acidimicrobiia bacterium]
MSGHSKWATIKRKKAANDSKRGKLFAKLIRAVEVAARQGGGDVAGNANLAAAVAKARANAVPVDNIDRAIARATGSADDANYEEIWYEGYGPGGIAIYVQVLTDNRNRAASDVRTAFTRNNGSLGEPGSVGYLFESKGFIEVEGDEDEVLGAALEAGAEDVRAGEDVFEVITAPSDLSPVQKALESAGLAVQNAEVTQLPKSTIPVDATSAGKVLRLVDLLEDLDDVQAVYANYEIGDELLAQLAAE